MKRGLIQRYPVRPEDLPLAGWPAASAREANREGPEPLGDCPAGPPRADFPAGSKVHGRASALAELGALSTDPAQIGR
jgi:hypothetical protein